MPSNPNDLRIIDGSFDDDFEVPEAIIDVSRPPEPKARTQKPPRQPPADKPVDAPLTQTELRKSLCSVYNLINRLLHVETRYRPEDWSEEADGLMGLINQFSRLRVIGRFLGPIAAMGAAWDKVDETLAEMARKRAAKKAANVPPPAQPQTSIDLTAPVVTNGAGSRDKAAFKS